MNMAEVVQLARIQGGEWGVMVSGVWGPVQTKDVTNLIQQIALTAHVAEGRNEEERQAALRRAKEG